MSELRRSARLSAPPPHIPSKIAKLYPELTEGSKYLEELNKTEERASSDEDNRGSTSQESSFAADSSRGSVRETEEKENYSKNIAIIVAVLAIVSSFIGARVFLFNNAKPGNFEEYVKQLQTFTNSKVSSIDNRIILKVIGQKAFSDASDSPQAVVISGNNARLFAEDFKKLFQDSQGVKFKGQEQSLEITENMDRAEIHEKLLNALEDQKKQKFQSRAVVVNDIDLLKWDAVLAIHAFADHETYPVPRSLLIFTIQENHLNMEDGDGCDEKVGNHLSTKWRTVGATEDNISPIISRIQYYVCI